MNYQRNKNRIWPASFLMLLTLSVYGVSAKDLRAVTEYFSPFQIKTPENSLSGYSVDVVNALSDITGDNIEIDVMPWTMAYNLALDTPNMMIFSIGKNDLRLSEFHWVGSLAKEQLFFWKLSESPIANSTELDAFRSRTITAVKDATTHQFLRQAGFENLYLMSATESNVSEESRIKMLIKGRAEIMIATEQSIISALTSLGFEHNRLTKVYRAIPLESELFVAFNKHSDIALVQRYRDAYEIILENGTLQALRTKWQIK